MNEIEVRRPKGKEKLNKTSVPDLPLAECFQGIPSRAQADSFTAEKKMSFRKVKTVENEEDRLKRF